MTDLRTAAQMALDTLDWHIAADAWGHDIAGAAEALRAALAQPEPAALQPAGPEDMAVYAAIAANYKAEPTVVEPAAYGYASRLAVAIWEKHYKDIAPQWKPTDNLMGVLSQIDNMTTGLTRQQAEPTVVEPVLLQCTTCGTVYAEGVPPQVPVQKPVAWMHKEIWLLRREVGGPKSADWDANYWQPLYASPAPPRAALTQEQVVSEFESDSHTDFSDFLSGVRFAERLHGIGGPRNE